MVVAKAAANGVVATWREKELHASLHLRFVAQRFHQLARKRMGIHEQVEVAPNQAAMAIAISARTFQVQEVALQ